MVGIVAGVRAAKKAAVIVDEKLSDPEDPAYQQRKAEGKKVRDRSGTGPGGCVLCSGLRPWARTSCSAMLPTADLEPVGGGLLAEE